MIDDPTLSETAPADSLSAQLQSFQSNPNELDLFRKLKTSLKRANRLPELAQLYEMRAAATQVVSEATRLWFDSSLIRQDLGDTEALQHNYRQALKLDPAHEKIASRYFEQLVEEGRFAEAADVADYEIETLESKLSGSNSPLQRRLANRYRAIARLWQDQLGRLDRALSCWQRSFQLEPHKIEALEQSRIIYTSLGDEQMVVTLYEAELQLMGKGGNRARRAEIELALGRLKRKRADTQGAAKHLQSALELDPQSEHARESLAEILASLEGEEEHRRASQLFVQLSDTSIDNNDQEGAITFLRRALGVNPSSQNGYSKLENVLRQARRWKELDQLFQQQLSHVHAPEERVTLLSRRLELFEKHLDDREMLKAILAELSSLHSPGSEFGIKLRSLYEEDGAGEELIRLLEADLATKPAGSPEMIALLLELAATFREQLQDRDRAAETLHRVLSYEPLNHEALTRYLDHFRERRDWRGLTDLNEYTIDQLREHGAPVSELVSRLETVAELCETRLGDIDRAILTWRRIQELEGPTQKTNEALRGLMSRAKMWESLVGVLEQEAEQATSPQARAEALRRIAQVYRERQVNPRRAISIYEEIISLFPADESALKSLGELYEREGDEAGLAHTLRRQLDLDAEKLDAQRGPLDPGEARDWPTAKRVERLTALRRLGGIYETQLADVEGVVYSCSGILELLPGDREALERMSRVLEKAGDSERLEQTLQYHVACSTAPVERSKLLRRLARLAQERDDEVAATERWEKVLTSAPNDSEALKELTGLYEKHQRFSDLAEVMDRALMNAEIPRIGSAAAAEMSAELKRFAKVLDEELKEGPRAGRAWQRVLEISERDRDALNALCRIYEEAGKWRDLCEILERQIPLYSNDNSDKAAEFALQRAEILEGRLGAPELATQALEHLIAQVSPRNLEAHRRLRRLHETRGNFEPAIRVAEREMVLTDDLNAKINRGLEIGILCRDRINDPKRALQSYERVLKLDPDHTEALTAASELYATVGRWRKHVVLLEKRAERTEDVMDKRALLMQIATVTSEKLSDHRTAFQWYTKAHELHPDTTTLGELRRVAEAYGLWRELANVYEADREELSVDGQLQSSERFVSLSKDIAQIAENRLQDPKRAMDALWSALQVKTDDSSLLQEAERIATEANRQVLWERLLDCVNLPLETATGDRQIALYLKRAKLREEKTRDMEGALGDLLSAFSYAPKREEIQKQLYSFGDRQKRWPEILTMETALAQRAANTDERIEILRRKANAYEERAKDPIRAYRVQLSAFILAPENEETIGDIWRLARKIGSYTGKQRTPEPEPEAAHIAPKSVKQAANPTLNPMSNAPLYHLEELPHDVIDAEDNGTLDITIPELSEMTAVVDGTQELDICDMMDDDNSDGESMMELRTGDLIEALGIQNESKPPAPPPISNTRSTGNGPPPPPPPRPTIKPIQTKKSRPKASPPARPKAAASKSKVRRTPIPTSPKRAYSSPWSELATVYCKLPAKDDATSLRWRYLAAQAWETGAKEVGRALDVLSTALRALPTYTETHDRLFQLASTHNEWDRLAQLYDRTAETASSAQGAAELLMRVATIRSKQGRPRETESLYRRVLGMQPSNTEARQALEELYRAEERWVDLAAQLEERTDPRLGTAAPIAQRPALLRELADLYSKRLSRQHDAIDTLERLQKIEPENVELLSEMARLHESNGKWSKVIQTLTRVCDLADGQDIARDSLAHIAKIYEEELELPDRAITSYSALLREWPRHDEAFHALDRLYQQYSRWEALEEILKLRATIVREPDVRAVLLRRRALILLNHLNMPAEAAVELRHARTIDPENQELADDLVSALTGAGKEREAASCLEGRIATLREHHAAEGDIAALLIRLGTLRGEHLGDPIGANQVLQEALELVPSHPTALACLANLTSADKDPHAHAEARMREAHAYSDTDAKVEALLDAGMSFRDSGDHEGARDAFQHILKLRPYHADATWALSALVEQSGDVEEAIRLLNSRLGAASLEDEDRAEILTQLAALSRQAGVEAAAERRLEEALEIRPTHLPAILGLADLLESGERWQGLEIFLTDVLPSLEELDSATRAELLRRLAVSYEGLERRDDAYQTLIRADRLHRGSLLIKLSLGENRYKAKRWREAALHLAALAEHKDATSHPSEVAAGLYHAALAEIRSLRPDKAEPLYRAALQLKNNYPPALRALAEIELERGDVESASDLLTKQAVATVDPSLRLSLFETLGDMIYEQLHDAERAKTCYEAALRAAQPLESSHIPLLAKLLARQMATRDRAGAGASCELLASFANDRQERCERHTEAAQHFIDAEMPKQARSAADRAVHACDTDLVACDIASELAMAESDFDATAALLSRLLNAHESPQSPSEARTHALLWSRLAEARMARGDLSGAEASYVKSLEIDPSSPGALQSRRALINLWEQEPQRAQIVLDYQRELARATLECLDVTGYAKSLCKLDPADAGRSTLELAVALGYECQEEDVAFLAQTSPRHMAEDEAYKGAVDSAARSQLIGSPEDQPLYDISSTLWKSASLLWNNTEEAFARCHVEEATRITNNGKVRAAAVFTRIARALNAPATILYTSSAP